MSKGEEKGFVPELPGAEMGPYPSSPTARRIGIWKNEPPTIVFRPGDRDVLRITPDGRLEPGEGLSMDEVTRGVFNALAAAFPDLLREWAKANAD